MNRKMELSTVPAEDISEPAEMHQLARLSETRQVDLKDGKTSAIGALVVNADDWGRDFENTERTMECIGHGSVSAVSAMVFMEDSERAAAIAREHNVDAGLHLNFTTAFSAPTALALLNDHQERIARHLLRH